MEELLDDVVSNVPNAQAFARKTKEPALIQQQIIKPANVQRKPQVLAIFPQNQPISCIGDQSHVLS